MTRWSNWTGNVTASPARIERPATEAALQDVVTDAVDRCDTVRVAGSGHSFSPIVPSDDTLISLERLTGIVDVDPEARRATVRAGTTLAALNRELDAYGLAMANSGDIDRQTVAGALTTGTHGTGLDFGVLATQIHELRLLTAGGEFLTCSADETERHFRAAQVSLGSLGVVTELTLDLVPAYDLCLRRRRLPLETALDAIDRFHDDHRQWEFFWFPHTDSAIVKTFDELPVDADRKPKGADGDGPITDDLLGSLGTELETIAWDGICRLGTKYPETAAFGSKLAALTLSDHTEVGPSYEVFANPREVRFNESEYGVPAADLPDVVRDVERFIDDEDVPVQFPIECRFVGGDDPMLSPAHGRDSAFVAVHHYHAKDLSEYFAGCEEIFATYDGRPHWGKQHSRTAADLADLYPEWDRFQETRRELDPNGHFTNEYVETVLGPVEA